MGVARPDGDCPGASDDDGDRMLTHPLTSSATPSAPIPSAHVFSAVAPAHARTRGFPAPMKLLTFRPAGSPFARPVPGHTKIYRTVIR